MRRIRIAPPSFREQEEISIDAMNHVRLCICFELDYWSEMQSDERRSALQRMGHIGYDLKEYLRSLRFICHNSANCLHEEVREWSDRYVQTYLGFHGVPPNYVLPHMVANGY